MKYVPDWWAAALLSVAAWRTFQLIAADDILDRPRKWLLRLPRDWKDGDPLPEEYRDKVASFSTCPYCAGFWVAVVWWVAWLLFGDWALVATAPWVFAAAVIAQDKVLSSEE